MTDVTLMVRGSDVDLPQMDPDNPRLTVGSRAHPRTLDVVLPKSSALRVGVEGGSDLAQPSVAVERERRHLRSLTSLRFFAALAVFMHHALPQSGHSSGFARLLWEGFSGVTFFFVLSGFVLAYSYADRLSARTQGAVKAFYIARIARIYPLVVLVFVLAAIPTAWQRLQFGIGAWLPAAFQLTLTQAFIPTSDPITHVIIPLGFDAPAWSLSVEALFYALFPVMVVMLYRLRRPGLLVAVAALLAFWPLSLALGLKISGNAEYWFLYIFPPSRLADFLIGTCLGLAVLSLKRAGSARMWSWTALEIAALAMLGAAVVMSHAVRIGFRYDVYYLPPMALLVAVFAIERGHASKMLGHPGLVFLGDASFAFYLIHTLAMRAAGYPPGRTGHQYHVAAYAVILVVTIALSALVHRAYELPVQRWVKRRWTPQALLPPSR